jgi:patatin-related protein
MKELRFGLVCYGGVSLAIYMHGITSELHKLVRASNAHSNAAGGGPNPFPDNTTEHVYFEILSQIAAKQQLRVIVDVIAGTSAGGINGVALAKALAHDLDQAPLKKVWFDKASIRKLLSPWKLLKGEAILNGDRMLRWVHDALGAMNATATAADASLMPEGHQLDLFVTLTDCSGYRRTIDIHDPIAIFDREHRHVLNFSYNRAEKIDHFGRRADPGLTLAIRCTSSFPVAFGPVNLDDIGAVARSWSPEDRKDFIDTAFAQYALEKAELTSAYFVDGGVLNNRPFNHAVDAILKRPAKHEVDRRLLFMEPHPEPPAVDDGSRASTRRPALMQTARAALISIPSHQPIADALLDLARHNQRVAQIKHLVQVLKPKVDGLIQGVIKTHVHDIRVPEWTKLEAWREEIRQRAETEAGAAFHSYAALRINAVVEHLATAICRLRRYPPGSRQAILVARVVQAWAERAGIVTGKPDLTATQADFLEVFDLACRRRRLRFLVEYVNQLYPPSEIAPLPSREQVDDVKSELYALMAELDLLGSGAWLGDATQRRIGEVFGQGAIEEADGGPVRLMAFLDAHHDIIVTIVAELEAGLRDRLQTFNTRQAQDLAAFAQLNWAQSIIGDLLARYLGFAYWDLLLYPIQALSDVAELDTIEVTRISPEDTTALQPKGTVQRLKGVRLGHFGAFLSRSYRENDLLWGRLDAVERLFSVLVDVSKQNEVVLEPQLMWRGFKAVLDTEEPSITRRASRAVLANLRRQVDRQLAASKVPPGQPPRLPLAEAAD